MKQKITKIWIILAVVALIVGIIAGYFINNMTQQIGCDNNQVRCGNSCMDACSEGVGNCELVGNVYTYTCPPPF